MKLQVTGKNLDVTQPIVDYAERKLGKLARQLDDSARVELVQAVERNPSIADDQVAEATIWTKGPVLRARESSTDMYASIDLMSDKLDRQVKRYRERRRGRVHHRQEPAGAVLEVEGLAPVEPGAAADVEEVAEAPRIVKTKRFNMKPMHVEEAALQLDLVGHEFFVFIEAESGDVAVIYRRRDGDYGLIEPVRS
jgi:putative sigma-54 modulation protein